LVLALFLPRVSLIIAYFADLLPAFNLHGWVPPTIGVLTPRVLVLIMIFQDRGFSTWLIVHGIGMAIVYRSAGDVWSSRFDQIPRAENSPSRCEIVLDSLQTFYRGVLKSIEQKHKMRKCGRREVGILFVMKQPQQPDPPSTASDYAGGRNDPAVLCFNYNPKPEAKLEAAGGMGVEIDKAGIQVARILPSSVRPGEAERSGSPSRAIEGVDREIAVSLEFAPQLRKRVLQFGNSDRGNIFPLVGVLPVKADVTICPAMNPKNWINTRVFWFGQLAGSSRVLGTD
jgi:hypothetical protein